MIEITSLAAKKLAAYLSANNIESPVRITAMSGCGGPSLGLALDEKKMAIMPATTNILPCSLPLICPIPAAR